MTGSTYAWRVTRSGILARDGYRCQVALPGCTGKADQVHHTLGRGITGDDPNFLVAACRRCNRAIGEPKIDPEPSIGTRW